MRSSKAARPVTTVEKVEVTAAPSTEHRAYLNPKTGSTRQLASPNASGGMSEAMRIIVWITGVAFGIAVPDVLARPTADANGRQTNPVVLKLNADHDGFVNRQEAKQGNGVSSAFGKTDMNHGGNLDEDEFITALPINRRETAIGIARDGALAAKRYAVDSEITAKVKAALLRAEGLRSLGISVKTYKRRVQLSGFADSKAQIAQAGKIAEHEPGVKVVLNDLTAK